MRLWLNVSDSLRPGSKTWVEAIQATFSVLLDKEKQFHVNFHDT